MLLLSDFVAGECKKPGLCSWDRPRETESSSMKTRSEGQAKADEGVVLLDRP